MDEYNATPIALGALLALAALAVAVRVAPGRQPRTADAPRRDGTVAHPQGGASPSRAPAGRADIGGQMIGQRDAHTCF